LPNVLDALEHCKFLIEKGRGDEAAKLVLPRLEAQKRRANKEKRTRVQFDCDPQTYADFHGERSRYIEACGNNVPIAHAIIIRLLKQLPSESIARLAQED
jgi:hypothetical protein